MLNKIDANVRLGSFAPPSAAGRNEDIMRADNFSMIRRMRMNLQPIIRTVAILAAIVLAFAPFGASMAHAGGARHHGPVQTIDHSPVIATAAPMAMHDGHDKACCPANTGQAEGAGCATLACTSLPGALATAFIADGAWRPMRDCFFIPPNELSPYNSAPEHGPPRA